MIGDDVMTSSEKAGAQKTMVVTGASQGIGAGLVKRFLALGYNVVAKFAARHGVGPVRRVGQAIALRRAHDCNYVLIPRPRFILPSLLRW